MAYYAWTDITTGNKKNDAKTGDTVTAEKLGVTKEEFDEMVEAGSVREEKYPLPEGYGGSPAEYMKDRLYKLNTAEALKEEAKAMEAEAKE